jgi:regulator of protease activity HflC (stomatin/prohibitin superfamily)
MSSHRRLYDHAETPAGGGVPPIGADPAQESLSQALKAGFNVLRLIIIVLLVAYFLSGWFQINPGEQGLIARFGKLRTNEDRASKYVGTPVFGEGWHWFLPDPFDEKIRISGRNYKPKIYTFCFPLEQADLRKELSDLNLSEIAPYVDKLKPGVHGAMLSGDRNLSHGLFAIEYRIDDAEDFVRNIGETPEMFEKLLRREAENAIVRTVAGLPVELGDFTLAIKRRLSAELARLETGVTVLNVEAKTVEPGKVRESFLAVTNAKSERKEKESQAEQEANKILSKAAGPRKRPHPPLGYIGYEPLLAAIDAYGAAQATGADEARLQELRAEIDQQLDQAEGDVAIRLRQAASHANEIRERVQQEYRLFTDYRDTYRKYPALTVMRLWVRMRDAILSSGENEVFFVPEAGEIEIITNRDVQRLIDQDIKRYQERYKPGR